MSEIRTYREVVPFPVAWAVFGLFMAFSILFVALFAYQLTAGSIGSDPAPTWFYLVMWLLFDTIGLLMLNFTKLTITTSAQAIRVGFGIVRYSTPWSNIVACHLDTAWGLSYGGWGVRIARIEGKWRLGYTVIGASRVVLQLREGRFPEIAFSTNDPDGICHIVNEAAANSR